MKNSKGIFLMHSEAYSVIYGSEERREIEQLVDIYAPRQTAQSVITHPEVLEEAEIIFSGWGMARMDETFLEAASNLKIVFYGAGSIKRCVTEAFWERGIRITSSYEANAIPTSEFTFAQILLSLKRAWYYALNIKAQGRYIQKGTVAGGYGSTVGIISLGMIGKRVCKLLEPFDVKIIAYDPYIAVEKANKLNVELCSLEDIFRRADVISLHTPWLKETEGMISGVHLASMKPDTTFINTARGAIVREQEMIDVLRKRPDLYAVLDVTYPEPPVPGSPLYALPNVVLTPHIAGSIGAECQRMGKIVVEELRRFLNGEPLQWSISREQASIMA